LHQLFTETGSTDAQLAEEKVEGSRLPDLVCTLRSTHRIRVICEIRGRPFSNDAIDSSSV
jgi:hypothetical protein